MTPTDSAEKVVAELRETAPKLEIALRVEPPLTLDESDLMRRAAALIESQREDRDIWRRVAERLEEEMRAAEARVTALEAEKAGLAKAVSAVTDATSAYLPPDGISKDECLNRVLGATDNSEINAIMLGATNGCS